METTRKRRWWQFGLRDLMWLVLVVAVFLAGWGIGWSFGWNAGYDSGKRADFIVPLF